VSADPFKTVCKQATLEAAWRAIESNGRFSTSVTVRAEIDQFREHTGTKLRSLSHRLSRERFVFPAAKGIPIPKLKDGKKTGDIRPIVLADVESRIVQRAILDVLTDTPELQKYFKNPHSFGGLRKREDAEHSGVPGAIASSLQAIGQGATHVAGADISGFFTRIERHLSLSHTLRKVDGILNGWGKHYRFCNDVRTLNDLDKRVSELIRAYLGRYGEIRGKADEQQWRSLLGIASLSMIERTPLEWPKATRVK
jgi:hypothetical protein